MTESTSGSGQDQLPDDVPPHVRWLHETSADRVAGAQPEIERSRAAAAHADRMGPAWGERYAELTDAAAQAPPPVDLSGLATDVSALQAPGLSPHADRRSIPPAGSEAAPGSRPAPPQPPHA